MPERRKLAKDSLVLDLSKEEAKVFFEAIGSEHRKCIIEALVPLKEGKIVVIKQEKVKLNKGQSYTNNPSTNTNTTVSTTTGTTGTLYTPGSTSTATSSSTVPAADTSALTAALSAAGTRTGYSMEGKEGGSVPPVSIVTPQQTDDRTRLFLWTLMAAGSLLGVLILCIFYPRCIKGIKASENEND